MKINSDNTEDFDSDNSDSSVCEFQPLNPVTNNFFSDTDVILDSSSSSEISTTPSAPPLELTTNIPVFETESTVSPTDDSTLPGISTPVNLPVPANTPSHSIRPPLTPLPVASAINPRIIHIPDPSEIKPTQTPPPSSRPRIIPVARKSQSFRHRKSLDSSFTQIKLPTLSLQKTDISDIDNPYISEESNKTSDKRTTASELSSETFFINIP